MFSDSITGHQGVNEFFGDQIRSKIKPQQNIPGELFKTIGFFFGFSREFCCLIFDQI